MIGGFECVPDMPDIGDQEGTEHRRLPVGGQGEGAGGGWTV